MCWVRLNFARLGCIVGCSGTPTIRCDPSVAGSYWLLGFLLGARTIFRGNGIARQEKHILRGPRGVRTTFI
jgi:hypothetical protein